MKHFKLGFNSILPIAPGVIPFGAVMGAAFQNAGLSFFQAVFMDTVVYAGAAQLATVDLMKLNAAVFVVVGSGLIINLRFLLYSAAMSPYLKESKGLVKLFCAYTLTDQSYAAMSANQHQFQNNTEAVEFYMGSAVSMLLIWHLSVMAGFIFGNFAPASMNLDFAVPLSFIALLVPTLKSKSHSVVALCSSALSLLFYDLPLKSGLMVTALISMAIAWLLILRRSRHD